MINNAYLPTELNGGSKEDELTELMKADYSYPEITDPNIQYKLFKKREYYYNKIPPRPIIDEKTDYKVIEEYRYNACGRNFALHEHQELLSNIINPDTPYKGVLVFHGLGTGKTCVGVAIAEKFKPIVHKYNTKIYILAPGPILKEQWRKSLVFCTGNTYKIGQDKYTYVNDTEKAAQERSAISNALQYYRIMSYKSFHKKVLGEKIFDKKVSNNKNNKVKKLYRKNKDGDFERDIAVDRIYNLNNTLLIVDEAHNLTDNSLGEALEKIISSSINLKVVLMSATPMKNIGSDIVDLINFIRPANSKINKDKIFNNEKPHLLDFKPGGIEYLKKMINGYVSHVRGSDPLTFAKRIDKGVIPHGLLFTPLIRCEMGPFHKTTYKEAISDIDDALDKASEAAANIAFPGLSKDRKSIVGYIGREGINIVKEQLKMSSDLLNKKIGNMLNDNTDSQEWLYLSQTNALTGKIYTLPYLKTFSIKFYTALKKLNRLVAGRKGAKTAFIYSNLVKVGIDVFHEVLIQNGYLEYQEEASNYHIQSDTVCYYCGVQYSKHNKTNYTINTSATTDTQSDETDSIDTSDINSNNNSSTEYEKTSVKTHIFYPATFMSITGKSTDENAEMINEHKKIILDNVFSIPENKEGKIMKFVIGSKVMNEGVSMKNVGEVHILDAYFHLGKIDQVVGRGIRFCSHYKLMNKDNIWPYVNVYKYVVALHSDSKEGLSSEEILYKKAELKYKLINLIERLMKEAAFDCPLNINGNMFDEEIKKYEKCDIHGSLKCPAVCNYTKCHYKCNDEKLNFEYYDPERKLYRNIDKKDIDYSTFTHGYAKYEINYAKSKIKELYITRPVNTLEDITKYIKSIYNNENKDSYDDFFVFKALDSLVPITENDFTNFSDVIIDKNNTYGYLIYRDIYYIFQPLTEPENVSLYYRTYLPFSFINNVSIYTYLKDTKQLKNDTDVEQVNKQKLVKYEHNDTVEYYDNREEYDIVGIIDNIEEDDNNKEIFKIRDKFPTVKNKKRGTGIPTQKGTVCATAKSKEYLTNIAEKLGISIDENISRQDICNKIQDTMLEKEKYASGKRKITYIRIPKNHPKYNFPYNLEDRITYIINKIKQTIKHTINIKTDKLTHTKQPNKGKPYYNIIIDKVKQLEEYTEFLVNLGASIENNKFVISIN